MSRAEQQRVTAKRRITFAARVALSLRGEITEQLISDICEQVGLHPYAFRVLFPTDDELLDSINDALVDECASRLSGSVERFAMSGPEPQFVRAAVVLAEAWPLDRGGMIIRANRRLRALHGDGGGERVVLAERRFLAALSHVLSQMMTKLGREFVWPSALAVRVILDTYERSFEAWLMGGYPESEFSSSPYVQRTLPSLLEQLSAPRVTSVDAAHLRAGEPKVRRATASPPREQQVLHEHRKYQLPDESVAPPALGHQRGAHE